MSDPLKFLWPLVDAPEPVVAAHVVAVWPAGVQQWLVDLGLLREAALADRVLCPECHGHVEEVLPTSMCWACKCAATMTSVWLCRIRAADSRVRAKCRPHLSNRSVFRNSFFGE